MQIDIIGECSDDGQFVHRTSYNAKYGEYANRAILLFTVDDMFAKMFSYPSLADRSVIFNFFGCCCWTLRTV